MKKKNFIASLIVLSAIFGGQSYEAQAQPYFFRHYQVENGLSNNTVYCSVQDDKGFMWFGTKDGLNRFDGYHFKLFNITYDGSTLPPDFISCLLIDKNKTLWVGSQNGLYTFDPEQERLVRFIDSFTQINSLQTDRQGNLWFLSRFTICKYDFGRKETTVYPTDAFFEATTLGKAEDGSIWVGTPNGLLQKYDEASNSFISFDVFAHSPPASSNWIQEIYPLDKDHLFVGTSNQGLKIFDVHTRSYTDVLMLNPDKTTIYVRDIKQYAPTEFWIATESGIYIYDTRNKTFVNLVKNLSDPYALSDNAVYTLCKDSEGGIWAGTFFGGINYYSRQYAVFQKYFPGNSKNSISGSAVREICEDGFGNLWIGTEDAGLNKLNKNSGEITQYKPTGNPGNIAYSNIHGLAVNGKELWIGTFEHGLDIMDIASGKVKRHFAFGPQPKELKSNFVVSLLRTRDGVMYVGTSNSLFTYDARAQGFDPAGRVPADVFISCLLEGSDGTIWIGTHDRGLYYYHPVTGAHGHFENGGANTNSLATNTINAIYEDHQRTLWFSTEGGGLCRLEVDRKTFRSFTTRQGLPSNFIFKVLEDDQHNLWVTTSRGLASIQPNTYKVSVYTKDNGLLNDQFNYNSGYQDASGKMYFGSVKGLIAFMPDNFFTAQPVPQPFITGFQVQNKEVEIGEKGSPLQQSTLYTEEITLPYNQSSFSIDFAAPSYISPEMISFSYIMKGLDANWTEIKPNRKIYFTNLSNGTYQFRLKAGVNGVWSKETVLTVHILPPPWATTTAYIIYALLIAALGYYLLRSYHIIVEDKKEKEIYEAKIDFFTNIAHEIKTPLTLIKGPVENLLEQIDELPAGTKPDVVTMERNTNRLLTLVTQILDFRQTETKGFSIDFEKVNISQLAEEVFMNFEPLAKKKQLQYVLEKPAADIYALADEEALQKIFNNLINNAGKYATQQVRVRLLVPAGNSPHFSIQFDNDGPAIPADMKEKIFEPFYRLKDSLRQQGTGIGLSLARSLTLLHMGTLLNSLSDEGLNRFTLTLPFKPVKKNKKRFFSLLLKKRPDDNVADDTGGGR